LYGEDQQTTLSNTIFQDNTYGYYVQNTDNPNANFGTGNIVSDNTSCGIFYDECSSLGTIQDLTLQFNEGYGAFLISNSGDFVIGTNTISGNTWPLTIDCGSFPDISSIIPTSGNTNNDIRITSGTGTNTGTWHNFSDLNYIVTATPTLGASGNLTIAEGDSIKFNAATRIDVYGTFSAVGDEISFTRNGVAEWRGLWCYSGSTVNIDSCTIEYASYSSEGYGIYANSCTPAVTNTLIQNCDIGIHGHDGIPNLSGNIIQNNSTGIYIASTSNPAISSANTIQNNSTGIYFNNCINTPQISNQTILNNTGTYGAIYMKECGIFSLGTNTITGNTFPLTINILSYPDDSSLNNIPTSGNTNNDIQVFGGSTGNESFTWKELNEPLDYVVKSSITISNGGTLTIQDNIDVLFENAMYISIYGTLNCQGTAIGESDPTRNEGSRIIGKTNSKLRTNLSNSNKLSSTRTSLEVESGFSNTFRSPGILFTRWQVDDSWQGVRFQNQASGDLDYLTVEYASYGAGCGVSALNPVSMTIDNCSFQNCYYGFYGDNVPPATLTSFTNIETENNTTGIYIKNTMGRSLDNTISSTLNVNGIQFNTCNSPSVDAVVDNNTSYGVIFEVCDSPVVTTDVDNCGNGIYYSGCTNLGTIDNISVTNNTGDYGALRISDSRDFLLGSSNIITGNSWALSIDCGSFPDITSTIPSTGNTNNDIQAITGSGNNTGTWHLFSGFDYVVNGNQDLNGTLTIADGNTLKFNEGIYFNIDGILNCPGTSGNGITFTRDEVTDEWYGIRCQPNSTVDFDYCTIEHATHGSYYAVTTAALSTVSFDHCLIQYNDTGVYGNGVDVEFLSNNQIINNNVYGIFFDNNSNPTFGSNLSEWNDIYGNGTHDFRNGTADITVEYVYWGTENDSQIDTQIYDFYDDASRGIIDYIPYTNAAHDTELFGILDAPENLIISIGSGNVNLSWDAVVGATSYKVYSSDDPYGTFTEDTSGTFVDESWSAPVPNGLEFYYVTAEN